MKNKRDSRFPDIEKLIPQRSPVVMVDRMLSFDEKGTITEFEVREENIFFHKGLLLEAGVLENIAQSAAAWQGYLSLEEGGEVQKGYIGGIRNLEIQDLPGLGEVLETRVQVEHRVLGAIVLSAACRCGDRILARCELKVFMV